MVLGAITRFAPSPTGFLHIGGVRTALFNWLYARHTGGKMLLRIEDTDRSRSTDKAVTAIIDGLSWLGIEHDDEIVYQSSRIERHVEVANELLNKGLAYYCDNTNERETALVSAKEPLTHSNICSPINTDLPNQPAIRLKVLQNQDSDSGDVIINDIVHEKIIFQRNKLNDFVLLRSDGTPTYMLAVVVDDHDMGVTHVIRGDDHLTNTARQKQIYDAMGWSMPKMAHIPLIHGPDGTKLSKRHGAMGIEEYRTAGYLPDAIINYLARLGWSHGDDEIFSIDQAVTWFELTDIIKSPARFNVEKLKHLNAHYLRKTPDDHLVSYISELVSTIPDSPHKTRWCDATFKCNATAIMPDLKSRANTLHDIIDGASFISAERPLAMTEAARRILSVPSRETLAKLIPFLQEIEQESWSIQTLQSTIRSYAKQEKLPLVDIAQPLRASLTGRAASIGIFEIMHTLGRLETLERIFDQIGALLNADSLTVPGSQPKSRQDHKIVAQLPDTKTITGTHPDT